METFVWVGLWYIIGFISLVIGCLAKYKKDGEICLTIVELLGMSTLGVVATIILIAESVGIIPDGNPVPFEEVEPKEKVWDISEPVTTLLELLKTKPRQFYWQEGYFKDSYQVTHLPSETLFSIQNASMVRSRNKIHNVHLTCNNIQFTPDEVELLVATADNLYRAKLRRIASILDKRITREKREEDIKDRLQLTLKLKGDTK